HVVGRFDHQLEPERLPCDRVEERLDRHPLLRGREVEGEVDAVADVETGRLAGVLYGAREIPREAFGYEFGSQHRIEDDDPAVREERDRTLPRRQLEAQVEFARQQLQTADDDVLSRRLPVTGFPRLDF